ncbi:MAG: hypothetical protein M9882_09425 [Homoserinimonas sp.]|nr:hypothetical protein [Homoserinimonas sp.]MCW5945240.1 hypothetical protein [Cryobacterium sp.]
MRRLLVAATLAVVAALSLSSCSLWKYGEKIVGQWQQGAAANEVLSELTESLRARDDVESAESSAVPITMSASVSVVMRPTATPAALGEVTALVDTALRGPKLQPFKREFTVSEGGVEIRQTDLDGDPVDYEAELAYWRAVLQEINADLELTLGADREGNFERIFSTHTDATVLAIAQHYDTVLAIEAPAGFETNWRLPGIYGYADWLGPLPQQGVLSVLAAMAGDSNLLDDSVQEKPPGVFVTLPGSGQDFPPRFTLVENAPGEPVDEAFAWTQTLTLTRAALAAQLPEFQIGVQAYKADSIKEAYLHFGECAEVSPPTPDDRELIADLASAGIPVPQDSAGICVTFSSANP